MKYTCHNTSPPHVPELNVQDKVAVTIRVTIGCFFGYCLGVAYLPTIVPDAFRFLPGNIVSVMIVSTPLLMFSLAAVIPTVLVMFVGFIGGATILLAAATVSDGLMVGIYTIYTLFLMTLYTGKYYTQTSGQPSALISLAAVNALTFRPMVQEGGMEAVKMMWKAKGVQNPDAVWRNFLIASCWGWACVVVAIILPPFQTMRRVLSRKMLPAIFDQISTVLSGEQTDLLPLMHSWNSLGKKGAVAGKTFFEPRLGKCWGEDLVPPLKDLVVETEELIMSTFLAFNWKKNDGTDGGDKDSDVVAATYQDTTSLLKACSNALSSNAESDIKQLQDWTGKLPSGDTDDGKDEEENPEVSNASYIFQGAKRVRTKTLAYLEALNDPESMPKASMKERTTRMLKFVKKVVTGPLLPELSYAHTFFILFQPSKWKLNYSAILWSIKIAAGYIVLMIMGVYWQAFAYFRLTPNDSFAGYVFIGWHLVGYAFALMPTVEGTIKKGLQRSLGTCIGGFTAWLGCIVCSGSYDENAIINPYGFIAWLTCTTGIYAYFFAVNFGVAARLGMSKDHGYTGEYTMMVEAIVALEVFQGKGDRDALTANRIVATLTGVLAAMIFQWIPPNVYGGDPKYLRESVEELEEAFILLLKTFSDENQCSKMKSDDYTASLLASATEKYQFASFVWNNADQLRSLPIYKVNQDLRNLLEMTAGVGSMVRHLSDRLAYMVSSGMDLAELQNGAKSLLEEIESNAKKGSNEGYSATGTSVRIDDVVTLAHRIQDDFVRLENGLDNVPADTLLSCGSSSRKKEEVTHGEHEKEEATHGEHEKEEDIAPAENK